MSEIDKFLLPISLENPSGENMDLSLEFDAIRLAREEDDPSLPRGEWVGAIKEADWGKVVSMSESLLINKTKDLRVVGWLLEGWTKQEGFAGLARGLALLSGICQNFWDTLYPNLEEGGAEQDELRAGNLAWFVNNACDLARRVPLTESDAGEYALMDWEAASKLANDIRRSPNDAVNLSRNRLTMDEFNEARANTPHEFYEAVFQEVKTCPPLVDELGKVLDDCLGDLVPSLSPLRQVLETVVEQVKRFARENGADLEEEVAPPETDGTDGIVATDAAPETAIASPRAASPRSGFVNEGINSRQQALAQLKQIAIFFRETEPHSPVAYLAEKAAYWGNLPLHAWLKAVVKNADTLAALDELLGVDADGNKDSDRK